MSRMLIALLLVASARAMVIKNITGPDDSEVSHCSSGGGCHLYLTGTDLGSAFAPPLVYIGYRMEIECSTQAFTSSKNRIHCIVGAKGAPVPWGGYVSDGRFVQLPVHVIRNGKRAACWHVGNLMGAGCFARFDIGGTPRVLRVLTPTVESQGTVRLSGEGIDGGMSGAQRLAATLFRGAQPVLGSCGEKDCQASNLGSETVGCYSRPDAGGDGVSGRSQETQLAVAFSDATSFGCKLDELANGLTGGFFNLSLHAISDPHHRGDAYLGFLSTRLLDLATSSPFDAEMPPRITSIEPAIGSLTGGADLTVHGNGVAAE